MSDSITNEAPQQTGLTVQDLTLALQIIQVASSRGAFKADEMSAVGGLYDRIFKFLESVGAITTQSAAEQPVEQPAEEAPAKKAKKDKGE